MSNAEDSAATEVSTEDFADHLAATRQFIRSAVVPCEREIADADEVPADHRPGTGSLRHRRSAGDVAAPGTDLWRKQNLQGEDTDHGDA